MLNQSSVTQIQKEIGLSTPSNAYPDEEMYDVVNKRLQHLEAGTVELVDGDKFFSQLRTRYGIEA